MNCCPPEKEKEPQPVSAGSCCDTSNAEEKSIDWLLWGSITIVAMSYLFYVFMGSDASVNEKLLTFTQASHEFVNKMWLGLVLGMVAIALLSKIPREMVMGVLGRGDSAQGVFRAMLAGFFLDLCSHGILMVGAKLYERGASTGQVMAFLITSPWNSFSLTLILITLIGLPWVLVFILVSMVIGFVSGLIFNALVAKGVLAKNKNQPDHDPSYNVLEDAKTRLAQVQFSWRLVRELVITGVTESAMVVRWIMFSVVLAGLIRTFVDPSVFQTYFGPTLLGLVGTLVFATILEVCSEGSVPIAADIFIRAQAPGNSLAFLMAGASTDYTEMMVLKETTKSWKTALFLPLVTLPQIIIIAWFLNQ